MMNNLLLLLSESDVVHYIHYGPYVTTPLANAVQYYNPKGKQEGTGYYYAIPEPPDVPLLQHPGVNYAHGPWLQTALMIN